MASRYDIIHIDFQVNAGKANIPLQSIQAEAKKLRDTIAEIQNQIKDGKAAGMAAEQLGELEAKLKKNTAALSQCNKAEKDLIKGVDQLSKAIKAFNDGTLDKMSAGFQKAAINAANLAKTKLAPDSATYKKDLAELNALIQKASENLAKARLSTNELVSTIQKGGNVSKQALTQEVQSLQELLALLPHRSKEYDKYAKSLSVVKAKLDEVTASEQLAATRSAGRATLKKAQDGGFATASANEINAAIAKLKEYQNAIRDPKGLGKKQFEETTMAIKKLETQLQSMKTISKEAMAVLNSPKGKSFNELKAAIDEARAKLANMRTDTKEGQKAFEELAAKVKSAEAEMKALGGASKSTATSFGKAWSRLKTYIGLYMRAAVAIQKMVATLGDLMELSDKMGEVRKTTGFTAQEVGNLSRSLAKLDTRTPIQGLMELSAVAGQLGLKTEQDVKGFTEAANMLMVALPELGKEGATAMLKVALATGEIDKIRKQLQDGTVEGTDAVSVAMTKIGSTIDALRANSAAAAPAITDFVKRVGAVGAQSGISIDQIAALGSTVDALGMRVEMSATALSRMLPAIRNNAFDLARAIGVTPETIRNLYDTGRGMEAVLMILQHIKDSGADAESIETMLGKGGMADVMKDLNQQGARAGIVFAGLSQNVEELRRQLGVAKTAYEENVAIQNEYNKMNDTTAAKWERLKNQFEEMFVSNSAQKFLGGLIDSLRVFVDFISSDGPIARGLKALILLWGTVKLGLGQAVMVYLPKLGALFMTTIRTAVAGISMLSVQLGASSIQVKRAAVAWRNLNLAMTANAWAAVATAIMYGIYKLVEWNKEVKEAREETGRFAAEIVKSEEAVKANFEAIDKSRASISEANKKLAEAEAALERARRQMDGTKESAERLAKAEKEVQISSDGVKMAKDSLRSAIEKLNNLYGTYLGFMLSEISSQKELANAQELVNSKLRESITLRRKEAAVGRVEEENAEDRDESYGVLSEQIRALQLKKTTVRTKGKGGKTETKEIGVSDTAENAKLLKQITKIAQSEDFLSLSGVEQARKIKETLSGTAYENYVAMVGRITSMAKDYAKEYQKTRKKIKEVEAQYDAEMEADREESQRLLGKQYKEAEKNYANIEKKHAEAQGDAKKQAAADLLSEMDTMEEMIASAPNYYDLNNETEQAAYEKFVKDTKYRLAGMKEQREALLKEAGSFYKSRKTVTGGTTDAGPRPVSPWGTPLPADSSAYADMDADALVARRKQMNKFVRALQTDTDVNSVLKEDAQLRKAIENGMSSDMRTVIEWYNTERKKIQDELHGRHLTNTGDWLDAKSGRKTKKATEDTYALAELERYYQWRKEIIEDARIEEGLSETEFNRRMDALEQEHLKKRSDLRRRFTTEDKQFVIQFEQWWASVEELDEVNWSKINDEWASATGKQRKYNDRKMQKDLADMKAITVKQLNAIADIIAKERPYDGITKNLQDNLTKMGILFADLDAANNGAIAADKGKVFDDAKYVEENTKRLKFLLGEAENAYSITIEDLLRKMAENGLEAWADEIGKSNAMKAGLMAQLRTVFDSVQQAIKKEATLVRKEMDIVWNDVSDADGKSLKQTFEGWLSGVGQLEDSVKRANSLISAGYASENVANKLAIKQMQIRLQMQATYYDMMKKMWDDRIKALQDAGKMEDAEHARKSKNLSLAEEQKKLDEQRVAIAAKLEESQNNLYKNLREWGDLLASSLQSLFEASNAGNEKFYNERAKLRLTGGTGEMQQIIVIDNAGTSGAKAHYETHDEMGLLQREREIEQQNAVADAWRKVMDDINQKMNDMITDQINAMLQNASVDANTDALGVNTKALNALTEAVLSGKGSSGVGGLTPPQMPGVAVSEGAGKTPAIEFGPFENVEVEDANGNYVPQNRPQKPWGSPAADAETVAMWQAAADASTAATGTVVENVNKQEKTTGDANKKMAASTQSMYAKMTQAANLYGIAYQAMSNDNLSTAQKFEMIAVQAAGNAAISMLTADLSQNTGETAATLPAILAKCLKINPIAGAAIFAVLSALIGGLMGLAVSKVAKSKSEIASVTGANNSVASGRLSTGMLTYAEGNVNEFTDPGSLTPGRSYNVDGADGKTYRAKYTGRNPQTHITNGPEFHLAGEDGKEAIIDARTTRLMQMDDTGIWRAIQVLYNGGSLQSLQRRRRGRGIPAFAGGNLDDFDSLVESDDIAASGAGASQEQMVAFQQSLDRNSAVLERALAEGIRGVFDVYGKGGLIDSYDSGKKTATRYGQRY